MIRFYIIHKSRMNNNIYLIKSYNLALMESTQNPLGNIAFTFSETSYGLFIKAISNESIYEKTLAPNSLIDFREIQ